MILNLKKTEESKLSILDNLFFKTCIEKFLTIYICITFFTTIIFGIQLFIKKDNILLDTLAIFFSLFFYLFFKTKLTENEKKVAFALFKLNLYLSFSILINYLLLKIILSISNVFDFSILLYILNFGMLIGYIGLIVGNIFNEFFENIDKINLLSKFGDIDEDTHLGDAVIGNNVDLLTNKATNSPVILPLKDRFLHMLILGPTGCGKTSQSIIPMINRDMSNLNAGITVLEPKGDLAEKVWAMAMYYKRDVLYFNPILHDCPFFNPLEGNESDVIENMSTTFTMLNPDAPQFFKDQTDGLVRKSVKLLKRYLADDATLLDLNTLLWNTNNEGQQMIKDFKTNHSSPNPSIQKENDELIFWFLNDYYAGMGGGKGAPKTYENCSGVRTQVSKLVSNKYLRRVLNPPKSGTPEYFESQYRPRINFDKAFENGTIIAMSTAQGSLRELGKYLGYFIILQLQAAVFRRPGNEFTRKHNMLFIDEFQVYSNPGFSDMLTMGRSYRVACHLATQARAQIGMGSGRDGDNFVKLVSTNARNKIIYPGVSAEDAKYYSDEFGEEMKRQESVSISSKRFFGTIADQRKTEKVDEKLEARFSPTDIIYREFGYVSYALVKNNSVQVPGVSKIEYIDKELNDILDNMVSEFIKEQKIKEFASEEKENNLNNPNSNVVNEDVLVKTETINKPAITIPKPITEIPIDESTNLEELLVEEDFDVEETLNVDSLEFDDM